MQTKVKTGSITNTHIAAATALLFLANAVAFAVVPTVLPNLTVAVNPVVQSASATVPTGNAGSRNVRIGSFVISNPTATSANIRSITLADTMVPLGLNFQNLTLKHGTAKIGSQIYTLNKAVGKYSFPFSQPQYIAGNGTYVVDIYADILTKPANVGVAFDGVALAANAVFASDRTRYGTNVSSLNTQFALQRVYIAAPPVVGNLTVTLDPTTAPSQQLVMGTTGADLATFRLTASADEDIRVNDMYVAVSSTQTTAVTSSTASSSAYVTLKNFHLYSDGAQIGSTVPSFPTQISISSPQWPNGAKFYILHFTHVGLTIPKGSSKSVVVKADVEQYAYGALSNAEFTAALLVDSGNNQEPIVAIGLASAENITGPNLDITADADSNIFGMEMRVYRTKVTAMFDPQSPSANSVASPEQTIAIIDVFNSNNIGQYSAVVKNMNFDISSTGATIQPGRKLKIYRDSVSPANLLGTYQYPLGRFTTSNITDSAFVDVWISSQLTRKFVVTLDTSDMVPDSKLNVMFTMPIYNQGSVIWSDGVTPLIGIMDNYPTLSKVLVY